MVQVTPFYCSFTVEMLVILETVNFDNDYGSASKCSVNESDTGYLHRSFLLQIKGNYNYVATKIVMELMQNLLEIQIHEIKSWWALSPSLS